MLFITFCGISVRHIRFSKMHIWLAMIQILGCVLVYLIVLPVHSIVAQGLMICLLTPTATSAPVITGILGGSVTSVVAYSLIINIAVAVFAPLFFPIIYNHLGNEIGFLPAFFNILKRLALMMLLPMILAQFFRHFLPKINRQIVRYSGISFYLWTVALAIAAGRCVGFILAQDATNYNVEIIIAAGALVICLFQFFAGKAIGKKYHDKIAGGQSLGQKNTILGMWMCQMYLNPISSIGPGAYILWQNIINSYQVWRNRKSL
jgi:BASS family bile acid:Na+ symporter